MFALSYRSIGHATGTADRLYEVAGDLDISGRRMRRVRVFLRCTPDGPHRYPSCRQLVRRSSAARAWSADCP